MYKLLLERNYRCLVLQAEIVEIIASPVFTSDMIEKLYQLLQDHHHLFRQVYGKWAVTVNYHMCLHLPDIIADLGPPHVFGMLSGTPNSKSKN